MSQRIRGQEVTLKFSVDGEPFTVLATDFTVTQNGEIKKTEFIGDKRPQLDYQFSGYDFNFTTQVKDAETIRFADTIAQRDRLGAQHPSITLTVIYAFREPGEPYAIETYHDVVMHPSEMATNGRTEYVTHQFQGSARDKHTSQQAV